MSDIALVDGQYELDDFLFGEDGTRRPPYRVNKTTFDAPELELADTANPNEDSIRMGRDFKRGRVISFDLNVLTPGSALDTLEAMEAVWDGEGSRDQAEVYNVLRMRRGGRTRRVWGRPRRFSSDSQLSTRGWVPVTCDFQTVHPHFFEDLLNVQRVNLAVVTMGGFTVPFTAPLLVTGPDVGQTGGVIGVAGTKRAWPVYVIHGPAVSGALSNPVLEVVGVGRIALQTELGWGKSVTIDPRPWNRGVTRSDGVNLNDALGPFVPPLSEFGLSPDTWEIVLRGSDPSNTSFLTIEWYNTRASY